MIIRTIALVLSADDTFTETVSFRTGQKNKRSGKWSWSDGTVRFENLWIPPSFAPEWIASEETNLGKGQPKFTDPGHWSISPEYHWGVVVFDVFTDEDICFKKMN